MKSIYNIAKDVQDLEDKTSLDEELQESSENSYNQANELRDDIEHINNEDEDIINSSDQDWGAGHLSARLAWVWSGWCIGGVYKKGW